MIVGGFLRGKNGVTWRGWFAFGLGKRFYGIVQIEDKLIEALALHDVGLADEIGNRDGRFNFNPRFIDEALLLGNRI